MVVADASLGNVTRAGSVTGSVVEKVYSQSAYFVLLADKGLMDGREGRFSIIDARSHRLPRVCRSTYAAELLGTEEATDAGVFSRGMVASAFGYPMDRRGADEAAGLIPMTVVTDAKDVFDKGTSDTPLYGSQRSLAFTVAWLRSTLSRPRKWIPPTRARLSRVASGVVNITRTISRRRRR